MTITGFKILSDNLLGDYLKLIDFDLEETITLIEGDFVPVDYFQFYLFHQFIPQK